MNYKEKYLEEKGYLKGLAANITQTKHEYKEAQRKGEDSYCKLRDLQKLQYEYRHHHIAYSIRKKIRCPLENGELTPEATERYKQIERTVRDDNEPNWDYVREILETYPSIQEVDDEASVCVNS